MRIGLLHVDSAIQAGVYQYCLSVIAALVKNDPENEYIVINWESDVSNLPQGANIISAPREGFLFGRVLKKLYDEALKVFPIPIPLLLPFGLTRLGRWNRGGNGPKSLGLDLLICLYSTLDAYKMKIPYVIVVHDVMHRHNIAPRLSWKERVLRDFIYKRGAQHSILTVVMSEQSQMDLHKFYGIPLDKIKMVSLSVPPYINQYAGMTGPEIDSALRRFNLPQRFVFYPAHFWRHKNHANLVKALYRVKQEQGVEVPAVFVGAPKEAFKEVMSLIEKLGMAGQIFYLGYVSEEEIVALYKRAVALLMPSLHNINTLPVAEALVLGTCCLCANLDFLLEQLGDAGLFFDPYDEKDIAEKIWRVWNDDDFRQDLINKGKSVVKQRYSPEIFAEQWRVIVREAMEIYRSRGRALMVDTTSKKAD